MTGYGFIYKYFGGFFRKLFRIRVIGAENEPAEGGLLVCANHLSNWDVVILAVTLHRPLRFFAKKELFSVPIVKNFVSAMGAFPADRGSADLGALRTAMKILREGGLVGFFPQGTRCPHKDPRDTEIKHGCAVLSHRANAAILPVAIKTNGWKILPFKRVDVSIGKPITPEELNIDKGGKEQYRAASEYVFSKITEMLDE